jgi:hypothetical protein
MEQIALYLSQGGFEEGAHKEEGKPMRHELTLLMELTWSPMYNLASGNTVCGPLFVIIISHIKSKVFGDKTMYRVGIQQCHKARSNFFKK